MADPPPGDVDRSIADYYAKAAEEDRLQQGPFLLEAARTRELIAVGALAAMDQVPQLVAHARGALAFGAAPAEVREALWTALPDSPAVDEHMRRITARTR